MQFFGVGSLGVADVKQSGRSQKTAWMLRSLLEKLSPGTLLRKSSSFKIIKEGACTTHFIKTVFTPAGH
jgi:hypothetical protein